ncbi:MAG: nitroreductase [Oscillibacter sp.]|jgi:nitroreductase|nr:nitroreductase [Oscillibacter sp.]
MNETLNILKERRSIRDYKAQQIKGEELDAILEAGVYAPSAMGKQSATIVVVQDKETIAELSRLNAEIMGKPGIDLFYGAPTVLVVLADPTASNTVNADHDGALVMGNLMNAAWSLGIGSCWVNRAKETFEKPEGKALLKKWGLPETLIGIGNCVLGYAEGAAPAPKPRKENYIVRV